MADVAKSIEDRNFDILDINMGCPVPKVVNNGEGSSLLKSPDLIEEIVQKVSSAISKPVTVKVRIGFENAPVDIVKLRNVSKMPEQRRLQYMDGPDSSIIPVPQTGTRSAE